MLEISRTLTAPYRPQSNGLCERTNQTAENILRATVSQFGTEWDQHLDFAMMAYRAIPHSSTGYTPNMLATGR